MAPVFPPGANEAVRWSMLGGVVLGGLVVAMTTLIYWSPVVTGVNIAKEQPVPFSHQRHVQANGLDCRYCHTTVENSNFAGIPATETCMTCHSQILTDQPMFAPVIESWQNDEPMEWTRINDLPDFVYFDHSIHINRGIGCNHCHSNESIGIEEMRLTAKAQTFHMSWCLDCHKDPAQYIRPKDQVFNMAWEPGSVAAKATYDAEGVDGQRELGEFLVEKYNVEVGQLTNCSICHR